MKYILFSLFVYILTLHVAGQQPKSLYQTGQSAGSINRDILVDPNGSRYITGYRSKRISFPELDTILPIKGGADINIIKQSPAGKVTWATNISSNGIDRSRGIVSDKKGHIYIAGNLGGELVLNDDTIHNFGAYDIFIVKLDTFGNILWLKNLGGKENDDVYDIAINLDGDIIAAGYFTSSLSYTKNEDTITIHSAPQISTPTIVCISENGAVKWVKNITTEGNGFIYGVDILSNNDITVSGHFANSILDENGLYSTSSGESDIFVAKLSSNGQLLKINSFGSDQNDISTNIAHIGDSIYICGGFRNSISFGNFNLQSAGKRDGCLVLLDTNLKVLSASSYGGPGMEEAFRMTATDEYIFVTGSYESNCDFSTSENSFKLRTQGGADAFITKYDKEINWLWTQHLGGKDDNMVLGIDISDSTVIAAGVFSLSSSYDSIYGLNTVLTNPGFNGFVTELKDCYLSTTLSFTDGVLGTDIENAQYQWYDCTYGRRIIQRETLSTYRPTRPSSYQLRIVKNGCIVFSECYNTKTLSVDEISKATLHIYPNPVRDKFKFRHVNIVGSNYSIQDAYGRIVQAGKLIIPEIDCSMLKAGLYTIVLENSNNYQSTKMIKL